MNKNSSTKEGGGGTTSGQSFCVLLKLILTRLFWDTNCNHQGNYEENNKFYIKKCKRKHKGIIIV